MRNRSLGRLRVLGIGGAATAQPQENRGAPPLAVTDQEIGGDGDGDVAIDQRVVAHDFGAWVAYSWALLFKDDLKSLTLIDAGIPGVTLTDDIQLSDYKRKWNFIFQMLSDLPAKLTKGREDAYVGWWFENKVHAPGAITPSDVSRYAQAYAREGRMDAAFATSSKTWSSINGSSKASCQPRFWRSAENIPFRTWARRCGLTLQTSRRR